MVQVTESATDLFEPDAGLGLGSLARWPDLYPLRPQQLSLIHWKSVRADRTILSAPARCLHIPRKRWLAWIIVKILVLDHLAQHDNQAVQRAAGRPPGG